MKSIAYDLPKLVYKHYFARKPAIFLSKLNIFHPGEEAKRSRETLEVPEASSRFGFLKFVPDLSPSELNSAFNSNFDFRIQLWHAELENRSRHSFLNNFRDNKTRLSILERPAPIKIVDYAQPTFGLHDIKVKCMKETLAHRVIRSKRNESNLMKEIAHKGRPDEIRHNVMVNYPKLILNATTPKVHCTMRDVYAYDSEWPWRKSDHLTWISTAEKLCKPLPYTPHILMPDKETLVSDAGKLFVLDNLLTRLKIEGHRVLIYSQMTKMIDLLEEFMNHRKHTYIRLDGSSKIHERRDMVNDFQQRSDIFVFLLSTRAGGLGKSLKIQNFSPQWNVS